MRALRPDEDYSAIHSIYVDQWDWEQCINAEDRTLKYLKKTVKSIYASIKETELLIYQTFKEITLYPYRRIAAKVSQSDSKRTGKPYCQRIRCRIFDRNWRPS